MTASRTDRKKEETRQKIIAATLWLFHEQGIEATTMEQIAAQVDIAKGTLYNYFPVKEAIISEYIEQASKEKNEERITRLQQMPDTRTRMITGLAELMEGVRTKKELFEKYFVYRIQNMISIHRNESSESGLRLLGYEIIRLGQESGEIRKDMPIEILAALFEFVLIEIVQQFYKDPEGFKAGETIPQCVELFMNGAGR